MPNLDLTVPPWVSAYVRTWMERLNLRAWTVKISVEYVLNDDPHVMGGCRQQPDLNLADVTFRADIIENAEWKVVIIHELLHVLHSRTDHYVEQALIARFSSNSDAFALASTSWRQHIESFIHSLALSLYRLTEQESPNESPPSPTELGAADDPEWALVREAPDLRE